MGPAPTAAPFPGSSGHLALRPPQDPSCRRRRHCLSVGCCRRVLGGLKLPAAAVGRGQLGLWVWLGEQGRMMRGKKPGLVGDQILSSLSDSEVGPVLHRPFPGTSPCYHKHRLLLAPRAGAGGWDRSPVPTSHCHT